MIEYQKEGKIAVITINRPEALGAMTVKGFEELHDALVDFRDDDGLLVAILTGTGEKVLIFRSGEVVRRVSNEEAENAFIEEVEKLCEQRRER